MPISPDPGDTFAITFPEDARKPEAEQRRVICRQVTCGQLREISRAYKAAWELKTDDAIIDALVAILLIAAVRIEGPFNLEAPTLAERLVANFGFADFNDTIRQISTESLLSGEDRKKSARQSQSSTAASAPAAAG